MSFVLHTFRPYESIDAVIRLLGRHNLTKEELLPMREQFNELNGLVVPRVGQTYKIPLPKDFESAEEVIDEKDSPDEPKSEGYSSPELTSNVAPEVVHLQVLPDHVDNATVNNEAVKSNEQKVEETPIDRVEPIRTHDALLSKWTKKSI